MAKAKTNYDVTASKSKNKTVFAEDVVADVTADFLRRQKMRRPYELQWQLNLNFVMGNQYSMISGRGEIDQEEKYFFWQEKQVFNHIAPIVETRVSRLNKVRPHPVVRPFSQSESDVNSAKIATAVLDSVRDKTELERVITEATNWSEVCGTAFYKVVWAKSDSMAADGLLTTQSEVSVTACSPFEIYPDSNVCSSLEDCTSLIHAKVYPSGEVRRIWGVDVPGKDLKVFSVDSTACGTGGLGYNSTVPSITREEKTDQVLVIERYTRPNAEFLNGRLEIVAGDTLLYVGELPYVLAGGVRTFPFVRQTSYEQAGCFWGASVVERLIPVQRAYNAVKNRKHEYLNRLSMGVLTVEDGSVDTDNLEEEGLSPGKILVYRQGAKCPSMMDGGRIPPEFTDEEQRLLDEFETISGVSEFARKGATKWAVTSGVALQLIAEQDDIRLASCIDSVRQSIKRIAKLSLGLYKQFVSKERLLKLTDGKGKSQVVYFVGSDLSSDDIVFEAENDLTDSPATRRGMIMDLLSAGVLADGDGKLTTSTKTKVLTMMGFGNWESAQDMASLHILRASNENCDIDRAKVLEIDDHELHVETHTRYVISGEADSSPEVLEKVLAHIKLHKKYLEDKQ